AQMTRRYTAMDKIIFRHETILLMIVFGIGVVTPLLVLKFGLWRPGITLSIAITFFCVFSLIPFLKGVNNALKYDIGYANLYGEIWDAIKSENEAKAVQGILDLESICKGAIKESRKETTSGIIHFLSEIGEKTIDTKFKNATFYVIKGLKNIGMGAIEKGFDDTTLLFLTGALGKLRIGAAKNEWKDEALSATNILEEIGCKAAKKKLKVTTSKAIEGLKYVASDMEGIEFDSESVQSLCCLGVFATEYLPSRVDRVIQLLKEFEPRITTDSMIDWEESFVRKYPNLKSSLEEFKRRYKEG
ncbi:MAG: hypothetical protein KAT65_20660, partial [Methanophagales archaeon]|nr:hypothetical protein [Methanophagales archaeon]